MNAKILTFSRSVGLVAGAMLALSGATLLGAEKSLPADAFPNFDSYIKLSGQAASVSGDGAAFQSRSRQPENGAYGIEDFHYAKDTSKDVNLVIDGHALTGTEDYLGTVKWTKADVGSVEVGYKRFRTFYDGVGGFFNNTPAAYYPGTTSYYPGAATTYNGKAYTPTATYIPWRTLASEKLSLDRGKLWVDATLALPGMPVVSIKYVNETRSGQKDSTIWGDSSLTGLPTSGYLGNPISSVRKYTPSWIDVDERHQNLEATISHTIGKFSASLTAFTDKTDNLDSRYVVRFPDETKIFAVPSSVLTGKLVSSINTNNQINQAQTDGMAAKTHGVTGKMDVKFNDSLALKFAGAYEEVNNDITGDRPLTTSTPTDKTVIPTGPTSTGVQQVVTDNFQNLAANAKIKELTGTVALDWKVSKDLSAKIGFRAQQEYFHSDGGFTALTSTQNATTGVVTFTSTPRLIYARLHQYGTTPVVDLRYTGIKDVTLYFNGSKRDLNGTEKNYATYTPTTGVVSNALLQSVSENHGDYTLGANWKVANFLTLRAEAFSKAHKDGVNGMMPTFAAYYLLDLDTTGYKVSAIAKPFDQLTSTTRVVYQKSKGRVTGSIPTGASTPLTTSLGAYDSLHSDNYQISETIDWSPVKSCYFQVAGTIVYNSIDTLYPRAGVYPAASATANAYDVNRVLQNSLNNYYTLSALAGVAAGPHTDLQLQYVQYKASNGNANDGLWTMPYGVECSDSKTTVGIRHKFSDRLVMNAKLGYIDSHNDTNFGMTNYRGPMAYIAFEHAL